MKKIKGVIIFVSRSVSKVLKMKVHIVHLTWLKANEKFGNRGVHK